KGFVADVNNQQIESKNATESFIKGEPVDIHDVMITVEKAKTSFELLMELRNKGLDLYREVLRMQI
ncbi:MAG TPA: flagellar hook-basal body complex protein FliE, partial [Bacteroidota bacterium]|nr:flagellar hook-basal body complex protein FliE [Bacteroidota bacterium]